MTDLNCPYCGVGIELCHDEGAFYSEDDRERCDCGSCDKTFMVGTSISYMHESYCMDGDHKWVRSGGNGTFMECEREDCEEFRSMTPEEEAASKLKGGGD